jgi:hypothetical protein
LSCLDDIIGLPEKRRRRRKRRRKWRREWASCLGHR